MSTDPDSLFAEATRVALRSVDNVMAKNQPRSGRKALRQISVTDIPEIVYEALKAVQPYIQSQEAEEWLEAKCADYLAMIVNAKTQLVNNSRNMSTLQTTVIQREIANYRPDRADKKDHARCILAACLYREYHNQGEYLERINSMLKQSTKKSRGVFLVDDESSEYVARRNNCRKEKEIKTLVDGEKFSEEIEDVRSKSFSTAEFVHMRRNLIQTIDDVKVRLQGVSKSDKEKEIVDAAVSQLNVVKSVVKSKIVAVVGEVSSGKSTFLSNLIGLPGFLKSENGSTTSVVTEIEYAPTKNFTAYINFTTVEEHQKEIDFYYAVTSRDAHADDEGDNKNSSDIDEKLMDIERKFMALYDYGYDDREIVFYFDKPKPLKNNIGRESLVLSADSMHELANLVKAHPIFFFKVDEEDDNSYLEDNPAVRSVRIEGPFEHIPPGVTILDTPGLGDGRVSRSYRTLEVLRTVDIVWYASPATYHMERDWDQKVLVKVRQLGKLLEDVHIIATKADSIADRTDEVLKKYRKKMLQAYCNDYAASSRSHVAPDAMRNYALEKHLLTHMPEIYAELNGLVERTIIQFNTKDDDEFHDIQYWRDLLKHYGMQQQDTLAKQLEIVRELATKFDYVGVGETHSSIQRSMGIKFTTAIRNLKISIDDVLSDKGDKLPSLINTIHNQFDAYDARSSTKTAIMLPKRAGEFLGRRGKSTRNTYRYDLNEIMANAWTKAIDPAWNRFLEEVKSIQGVLTTIPNRGSLASNFHQQLMTLGRAVFEADVKEFLQTSLKDDSVYRIKRKTFPDVTELTTLFSEKLRYQIDTIVGSPRVEGAFLREMRIISTNMSLREVKALSNDGDNGFFAIMACLKDITTKNAISGNVGSSSASSAVDLTNKGRVRAQDELPKAKKMKKDDSA